MIQSKYNSFEPSLPEPIAFYALKHHLGYINQSIKDLRNFPLFTNNIVELCQGIGGSVLDLYTGPIAPISIAIEILRQMAQRGILLKDEFIQWIDNQGLNYRLICLSDGSSWTLRAGRFENRYIHVHPSRGSINTIRVKPSVLKTAIAALLLYPNLLQLPTIQQLNGARMLFEGMSPLKEGVSHHSILRIFKYVHS
jgi:hypothetical protein